MSNSNTHNLQIDGMTGHISVQRATSVLNTVQGVQSKSVRVGSATITCDTPTRCGEAIAALHSAGFRARETLGAVPARGDAAACEGESSTLPEAVVTPVQPVPLVPAPL